MYLPLNSPVQCCFAIQFFLRHEDGTFEEIKPPLSQDGTIDIKDFAAWGLGLQARYPTARRLEIRPHCELALKIIVVIVQGISNHLREFR